MERPRRPRERLYAGIAYILRVTTPGLITPSEKLAEAAVKLACGDGQPVAAGKGVQADGRTLRNTAIKEILKS